MQSAEHAVLGRRKLGLLQWDHLHQSSTSSSGMPTRQLKHASIGGLTCGYGTPAYWSACHRSSVSTCAALCIMCSTARCSPRAAEWDQGGDMPVQGCGGACKHSSSAAAIAAVHCRRELPMLQLAPRFAETHPWVEPCICMFCRLTQPPQQPSAQCASAGLGWNGTDPQGASVVQCCSAHPAPSGLGPPAGWQLLVLATLQMGQQQRLS